MKIVLIVYSILSAVMALGTIGSVTAEVVAERRQANAPPPPVAEPPAAPPPPEPEPMAEELPAAVEQIDAEEADRILSDAFALRKICRERGAGIGQRATVNIGRINECFAPGETVTLAKLKQQGLISPHAGRVKILADGILTKPLTVKAEAFSVQAVKMIELTGGTVVLLRD